MSEKYDSPELKRMLGPAWAPFFGRFGRLLPVQRAVIPRVLSGANLAVASPTASGKTEAIIAPIAKQLVMTPSDGLKLIYISPTRALVNDLAIRLTEPLAELALSVAVKTGDRPQFNPQRPADILLTTPEATDSLLCRHARHFSSVRAVVLDELHLIDGMYRGDQLRILLNRIRALRTACLPCHALSATLADPVVMAHRYFADPEPVVVSGQRELEYAIVGSLEAALAHARSAGFRKLLMFVNSRRRAEEMATMAATLVSPGLVAVHHGSLARREREDVEEFMRTSRHGLCVATMTLEIGIDIGDIDAVVLAEPPPSVSALLQRVGRGNRRTNVTRAIAICLSAEERDIMEAMFQAARLGLLDAPPYQPDLSVVVQQLFSMLFAFPIGMTREELSLIFEGFCGEAELNEILVHLSELQLLERRHGRWFASADVMDMGERGTIHSNIPDRGGRKVIEASTHRTIGEVHTAVDEVFALGGRVWRVVEFGRDVIYVRPAARSAGAPVFRTRHPRGAFARFLPTSLSNVQSVSC